MSPSFSIPSLVRSAFSCRAGYPSTFATIHEQQRRRLTTPAPLHVEEKILSLGTPIIPFLEVEWENNFNPQVQRRIEDLIHTLQFILLKERINEWYNTPDHDLITGITL